jgi:DNA-binding transcriptional MerR regulator
VRYRVEQLASACDVSVDTVRYYQSRGLLPSPEREGRVAWYGPEHVDRIREIRSLQRKGLTLAAIERVLGGELERTDVDLAAAVAAARGEGAPEELLTLEGFASRAGVPASLIQAVEREGIRLGVTEDGEARYTSADMVALAHRAVELFDEHVRKPIRDTAATDEQAAAQIVEAFATLLPAVTNLVATHFRRVLLATAEGKLE